NPFAAFACAAAAVDERRGAHRIGRLEPGEHDAACHAGCVGSTVGLWPLVSYRGATNRAIGRRRARAEMGGAVGDTDGRLRTRAVSDRQRQILVVLPASVSLYRR